MVLLPPQTPHKKSLQHFDPPPPADRRIKQLLSVEIRLNDPPTAEDVVEDHEPSGRCVPRLARGTSGTTRGSGTTFFADVQSVESSVQWMQGRGCSIFLRFS